MADQSALGFFESQLAHIERQVYAKKYPFIQYRRLVPISTTANQWADSITHYSMDKVGEAKWFAANSNSVPLADIERDQHNVAVHMAAIGYEYNEEELARAMMVPGQQLPAEKAMAARRVSEEYIDDVVLRGNADFGWNGLINSDSIVTVVNAPDGAAGTTGWSTKTPDEIIKDVNTLVTGIYETTKQTEMADTLLLPISLYTDIVTRRLTDSNAMTLHDFIMKANVYKAETGSDLKIMTVRGLEAAGPTKASTDTTNRIVAYRKDREVLKLHMPMPHRFLPIWRTGPLVYTVPGIFRLGGLEIRLPQAIRYMDGV